MSGFVLSSLGLVESRLWSGHPPEPPLVIAQPQTGRVARLSYAKGYITEVPREVFGGAERASAHSIGDSGERHEKPHTRLSRGAFRLGSPYKQPSSHNLGCLVQSGRLPDSCACGRFSEIAKPRRPEVVRQLGYFLYHKLPCPKALISFSLLLIQS
jgi:hypothetical protein